MYFDILVTCYVYVFYEPLMISFIPEIRSFVNKCKKILLLLLLFYQFKKAYDILRHIKLVSTAAF